jgi:hypothetical protein
VRAERYIDEDMVIKEFCARLPSRREPEIVNEPEDGVGKGFTPSRKIENGRWYACDFRGRRLFEE